MMCLPVFWAALLPSPENNPLNLHPVSQASGNCGQGVEPSTSTRGIVATPGWNQNGYLDACVCLPVRWFPGVCALSDCTPL